MKELSYLEKMKLPVEMLFDPVTGRAAAFTSNHRSVTGDASEKLIAFLKERATSSEGWDESKWKPDSEWRPMPAWATLEVRERCQLIRAQLDFQDDDALRLVPRK